jgi:hypothetical protein
VSFHYLPVGDCLGVPLLALPVPSHLLNSGPVARGGGGGMDGFSSRSGGGSGSGAELCCPHLGGVGEDATGGIIAAGIHLAAAGGWGSEARAACARAGEGEGVQINWFRCLRGPSSICTPTAPQQTQSHNTTLGSLGVQFFFHKCSSGLWRVKIFLGKNSTPTPITKNLT